jgi:hypothetical protein
MPGSKYFVYLLVDPRNDQIFYIGKGTKNRPYDHIKEVNRNKPSNQFKFNRIKEILCDGYDVEIIYFDCDLEETEAIRTEALLIKAIGTQNITNILGGVMKDTAKEHAVYMLSTMLPFNVWVETHPNCTDFEKELYSKVKDAWTDIAMNGYVYALEERVVNGKMQVTEKRRM